ncbi:hypothetical protein N7E81_10000 [Reichenbachiella carrageenanivorans]|uniref:Agarase n=1 Tax=Reichenbachiella carrageenanivorans TaxID=2979869 RepID=A0ABY6CWC0_9BACT|nr:hypothetical protein [Reichenbachiella carrageenanivorans]UXX77700.1 hypothetical protein N7E81_10000 [Reichenbachiella carrageenanivorans]
MKKSLFAILITALAGCSPSNDKKIDQEQEYIYVDAKVKVYHKDGTRSYKPYEPFQTRTVALLKDYETPSEKTPLSKYGGMQEYQTEATGFYHVKKIDDRWWGIDPSGYRYFNIALNGVKRNRSERNKQALIEKFGSNENWLKETVALLQENGFNATGSWSDHEAIIELNKTLDQPIAYAINLDFMGSYGSKRGGTYQQSGHRGYPNNAIFVFDPEFEAFCDEHAQQLLAYKDDPNLFGYFSDNEMPFKFKAIDNYLGLPETDHGYLAAKAWLDEQGITQEEIKNEHRHQFMSVVADKYFSVVSKAIKKHDPNHMYIGSRFYSSEKDNQMFMETVGKYLDAISINYYNKWTPDSTQMANWANWSGRPFIITEYYTKGEDSGMGNKSGAGWIVRTQEDRGLFYQNYNLALLESKNCVGWHYFKYQDNDPQDKTVDPSNIDANKGIVTSEYVVWESMLEKMNELNHQVYPVIEHFDEQSATSNDSGEPTVEASFSAP